MLTKENNRTAADWKYWHIQDSGENNKILVSAHRMGRNLYHIVLKPANSASNPKLKVTLYLTKPSSLKEEVNTTAKNIPRFVSVLILKFPISPLRKRRETEALCLLLSIWQLDEWKIKEPTYQLWEMTVVYCSVIWQMTWPLPWEPAGSKMPQDRKLLQSSKG